MPQPFPPKIGVGSVIVTYCDIEFKRASLIQQDTLSLELVQIYLKETRMQTKRPLVLVADDENNAVVLLKHIFERDGFEVDSADNGVQALEKARL